MSSLSAPSTSSGVSSSVKAKVRPRTVDPVPPVPVNSAQADTARAKMQPPADQAKRHHKDLPREEEEEDDEEDYGSEESYDEFEEQCDVMGQALGSALAEHFTYQTEEGTLTVPDIMLMTNETLSGISKQLEVQNSLLNKLLQVLSNSSAPRPATKQ